jgi:O-antigen ligase
MSWINTPYFFALVASMLTVSFFYHVNSLCLAALVLVWLFANSVQDKWRNLRSNFLFLLPFFAYYLAQVYGFSISENAEEGRFMLEKKMAIAIVPFVLATGPIVERKRLFALFNWYSYGITAATLFMLMRAINAFLESDNIDNYYYHSLSGQLNGDIHAVYLSMSVAIALLFFVYKHRKFQLNTRLLFDALASSFLLLILVLLSSKTILVGLLLILIALAVRSGSWSKNPRAFVVLFSLVVFALLVLFNTRGSQRFKDIMDSNLEVLQQEKFTYSSPFNGLTIRLILWQEMWRTLKSEKAIIRGVGSGDFMDELAKRYVERGLYTDYDNPNPVGYQNYNPHNQFLQDWLMNGILGLFSLISILALLFWKARSVPYFLAGTIVLFAFFLVTESALQRHHGLVLFALISGVLLLYHRLEDAKEF